MTGKLTGPPAIAVLVCSEVDGGVAEHVRVIGNGLAARGRRVIVAAPPGLTIVGPHPNLRLEALAITGSMVAPRSDTEAVWTIASLCRREHAGVVHGVGQKGGVIARLAGLLTGTPTIYSPAGFGYRTQMLRQRPGARLRRAVVLAGERCLGRATRLLIACCEDERRAAISDRIVPADRVIVVRCGVPLDAARVPDGRLRQFAHGEPLIGFVTGLREQKGLPLLFDALDLLWCRGRLPLVVIVGNGDLEPAVRERIVRSNFGDRVLLLPYEPPMERYLSAVDAYVHPTYWEGLPIAVLEAMAAGLPVVATAVNGVPEAIDDDRTGLLVPPKDPQALADAIDRLVSDQALRTRLGSAARAEVEGRFDVNRMLNDIEQIYNAVSRTGRYDFNVSSPASA